VPGIIAHSLYMKNLVYLQPRVPAFIYIQPGKK